MAALLLTLEVEGTARRYTTGPEPLTVGGETRALTPDFSNVATMDAVRDRINTVVNAAAAFDQWFLNLFPREATFVYNSGGYQTLNFVPSMATMLLGLIAGDAFEPPLVGGLVRSHKDQVVHRVAVVIVHLCKAGAVFPVILSSVAGDVFAPADALALGPVTGEGQAGHAVALGGDQLALGQEAEDHIM